MKLIAETATHHQGDFDFMMELTRKICTESLADIVKFHVMLDLDEYFMPDHDGYKLMKNWMFDKNQWSEIFENVQSEKKDLMLLFNDTKAIEFGMDFNPKYIEIHSVCLNDLKLLTALKSHLKPEIKLVLGVGGTTLYEIENAINFLQHDNIVLMFGFQNFPTKYDDINFGKIKRTMRLFSSFEFGYADHTAWNHPDNELITMFGAAQGMQYIEKHITTEYGKERVDWSAAISFEKFNKISEMMKLYTACYGDSLLKMNQGEENYSIFGPLKKAGILNRNVSANETISLEHIDFKRTSQISDMSQIQVWKALGKKYTMDISKDECLNNLHVKWV